MSSLKVGQVVRLNNQFYVVQNSGTGLGSFKLVLVPIMYDHARAIVDLEDSLELKDFNDRPIK